MPARHRLALPLLLLASLANNGTAQVVPPNVVLVIADDLGYGDLGSYGSSIMRTPHLDRLADGGIRFTDAYVAAAVCSPSRAGLMTGRYPQLHGYEFNTSGRDVDVGLSTEETTLGDLMTQARYATGYIGKWHLGKRYEHHPLSRGFGEYFGCSPEPRSLLKMATPMPCTTHSGRSAHAMNVRSTEAVKWSKLTST